jgi:hypothetical protein
MDTQVEQLYKEYLQEAKLLQKGSLQKVLPFLILGAIFMCGGLSAILWAGYETMAILIFWGVVLSLVIEVIGIIIQTKWLKEQTTSIARTKPGFDKFLRLYNRRQWPMEMVTGKKKEKFLEIIATE